MPLVYINGEFSLYYKGSIVGIEEFEHCYSYEFRIIAVKGNTIELYEWTKLIRTYIFEEEPIKVRWVNNQDINVTTKNKSIYINVCDPGSYSYNIDEDVKTIEIHYYDIYAEHSFYYAGYLKNNKVHIFSLHIKDRLTKIYNEKHNMKYTIKYIFNYLTITHILTDNNYILIPDDHDYCYKPVKVINVDGFDIFRFKDIVVIADVTVLYIKRNIEDIIGVQQTRHALQLTYNDNTSIVTDIGIDNAQPFSGELTRCNVKSARKN